MGGPAVKSYQAGGVVTGPNPRIDEETRARALASVASLGKPVAVPAKSSVGATAAPGMGGSSGMSLAARGINVGSKPPVVTKEELAKSGMSLRDYMNKQQGLTRRQDNTNPDMGDKADAAFLRKRIEVAAEPTADEIANQQRKEKLNRLKIASAGAESKMRQANALSMSRADFVGDTKTESEKEYRSKNLTDFIGLSSNTKK
jgi:hypothetical protein